MYKVYCDDVLIFDSKIDFLKLYDMNVELELNKTGSFIFTIYHDHFAYNAINKMKSIIKVYQDEFMLFKGRVIDDEIGFHNEKQVICEGELAFLLDSVVRPYEYSGTIEGFLTMLIENHNNQVEEGKRFTVGNVTVTEDDFARTESEHQNTLETIQSRLIDTNGGYIVIRHEGTNNFIDYLSDFDELATQRIKFGKNLIDMKLKRSGAEIATAIIPLGAKDDETGERITIKTVNNGSDYLFKQSAVSDYGWIFKTVIFDDIKSPANLLNRGNQYLLNQASIVNSLELDAADISSIDRSVESFRIGTYVKVTTEPHSIDQNFLVDKVLINLLKPEENKLTLGTKFLTFTEKQNKIRFIKGEKGVPGEDSVVYNIEIVSSNGNFFKNGVINTILSCHVFMNDDEITDEINASRFKWQKINNDGTHDTVWEASHAGGTKEIAISSNDVHVRATFTCKIDGLTN